MYSTVTGPACTLHPKSLPMLCSQWAYLCCAVPGPDFAMYLLGLPLLFNQVAYLYSAVKGPICILQLESQLILYLSRAVLQTFWKLIFSRDQNYSFEIWCKNLKKSLKDHKDKKLYNRLKCIKKDFVYPPPPPKKKSLHPPKNLFFYRHFF